jgi:hypothetical protein
MLEGERDAQYRPWRGNRQLAENAVTRVLLSKRTQFACVTDLLKIHSVSLSAENSAIATKFHLLNLLASNTLRAASEWPKCLARITANFYNPPPKYWGHSFS